MNRPLLRAAIACVAAVLTFGLVASPADAHSFLVRTSPQPGARLTVAPTEVVLDFTDPVAAHESTIALRDAHGVAVTLLAVGLDNHGTRLRASLPALADGVYQVTWRAVAQDAHSTEGEYVFAVGVDLPAGAVLTNRSTSGPVQWADALATLALLAGIAVALGGQLSERFVWPRDAPAARAAPITGAISVALCGALGGVALVIGRADRLATPARWAEAFVTRADRLTLAVTVVLCVGLLLVHRARTRPVGIVPVVAAGVLVALRGHGAEAAGWWSSPAAAVHLLIGGAWTGALTHLAVTARAERDTTETIEPGPSRYAAAALVAALATLIVGPVVAFGQLEHVGDLINTRYGQILLVKLALVGLGLATALAARRQGIPATGTRIRSLARYTTIEALLLGGVLAASALLSTTAPARGRSLIELGPTPLPKPTTLTSDLAGSHQVLVSAAVERLQVLVLPPGGQPSRAQRATFEGIEPDGTSFDFKPRLCGPGCYDLAHQWRDGITRLTVAVTDPDADSGSTRLEIAWPPGPDASSLLSRAIAATANAATITVTENVSSGPSATTGPSDLTISGAGYIDASPFKAGADDIHQQPDDDGFRVITFAVSGTGTWHKLWIDPTDRIRRETLVDPGHRIDRVITYPRTP